MITLRLDRKLESDIEKAATSFGVSKSELVRKSIIEYLSNNLNNDAWRTGKNLFGKYSSENENLAENSKWMVKEKIGQKNK